MPFKTAHKIALTLLTAVALVLLAACGGDDDDGLTVSDLEGSWKATSFTITSNANPSMTVDVVTLGVALSIEADDSGNATGTMELPDALGGPLTVDFQASFVLVDQETITVTFAQEFPPLLTSYTGPFTLEDDTMTLTDEGALFDFEDGGGPVSVTATGVLVRQ